MSALLTAEWFSLGRDIYFRKFDIYSMSWHEDINLEDFLTSSAPYGGPIAIRRNDKKFIKVQGTGQPIISIFSGSGKKITSLKWNRKPIVCMGWSNDEKLICVEENGMVVLHDMFGKFLHAFSISQQVQNTKVEDAQIFTSYQNSTGVAVMTTNYRIFLVNNITEPRTRSLSEIIKTSISPSSWAVVPEDPYTEVLMSVGKELCRLRSDEQHSSVMMQPDINDDYMNILKISVSFNARHIALFTDSGIIWLGSSNLRIKYCEIPTGKYIPLKQMVWCGNEAVVLFWEHEANLLIVSKHGYKVLYNYESSIHLVSEIDCVRIISNTEHELLQKVPNVVQKIFRINSTEPGSFLLEASKKYQLRSHRANEYISLVKDNLPVAVDQCLDAVGYEFDIEIQKMLIRAAQFGKCFLENMYSDKYVEIIRLLRVLNAVRDPKIGIPITITQLTHLTQKVLLDRLITRKEYYLALQIAKYLKMSEKDGISHILVNWAKYKVSQSNIEEESVAREIADKLGYTAGISYSEIATTAVEYGRKKLAIKLLDYELKASEQVKLLLKLEENTTALIKSIESGDTDLIYMVILKIREKYKLADFKICIRNFPVAQSLYIKYCKEHNEKASNEPYIQEDDFNAQAEISIIQCLNEKEPLMKDSCLISAIEKYKSGRNDFYVTLCEEYLKLLRYQRDIDSKLKTHGNFTNLSIHDTLKLILEYKEYNLAEKFKNDFKIPEERYYWLLMRNLAKLDNWSDLEKLTKNKKLPIGYYAFVDVCLEQNKREEALKYLPKVNDDIKVKYYIKAGCLEEAAKIAFEQKDKQSLLYVQSKCNSLPNVMIKINNYIKQLDKK